MPLIRLCSLPGRDRGAATAPWKRKRERRHWPCRLLFLTVFLNLFGPPSFFCGVLEYPQTGLWTGVYPQSRPCGTWVAQIRVLGERGHQERLGTDPRCETCRRSGEIQSNILIREFWPRDLSSALDRALLSVLCKGFWDIIRFFYHLKVCTLQFIGPYSLYVPRSRTDINQTSTTFSTRMQRPYS